MVLGDFGLEWRVNVERFKIIAENLSKSFQNIILMSKIATSIANVFSYLVEIK
jgi:hypothetical protein